MAGLPSKRLTGSLTQEAFDQLLSWLDSDREVAGLKYEKIRGRLIRILQGRGCAIAAELADETIDRVARKVGEISNKYIGDPALYFYGVANIVHLEYVKSRPAQLPLPSAKISEEVEDKLECLDQCLEQLSTEHQELIMAYYGQERRLKIQHRAELAERLGIGLNALWIRAHRIRKKLADCVGQCLERKQVH